MAVRVLTCSPQDGWTGLLDALRNAIAGDSIRLCSGTYTGDEPLKLPPGVTLCGEDGVVLACSGEGNVLEIRGSGSRARHIAFQCAEAADFRACILVDHASDAIIESCSFTCHSGPQLAIYIVDSDNVNVHACQTTGFLSGIATDDSVDVDLVGNLCMGSDNACIVFAASSGQANNNECRNSKTQQGILVDRQSDIALFGNRCHDNDLAGIAFNQSRGRASENECTGARSGSGIVVRESVDVEIRGNRCLDNAADGIVFTASTGQIEDNTCHRSRDGNGIGILNRSEASVISNSCCENEGAGISFFSSNGSADDNNCHGNRAGLGISVSNGSRVSLSGNRCHDNAEGGIGFFSSTGRVQENECLGSWSGPGILIHNQCDVTVISNRCHNNKDAGITFSDSCGRAEANKCWGSRSGSGILVLNHSNVSLVANFCHDNENEGIVFSDSSGHADGNDCRGSRSGYGILANHRSDVRLIGNRCHDNELAGIVFHSSSGHAENNQCTGSLTSHGIIVNHQSNVTLAGNVCNENRLSGIVFGLSTGRLDSNKCVGSLTGPGIHIQEGSQVEASGNYCAHNNMAGILFDASAGIAENNECHDTAMGCGIRIQAQSNVSVIGNRCHNNGEGGIVFYESIGTVQGNDCWRNRNGPGISIRISSNVAVASNLCHHNLLGGGIVFYSSTGTADDNACWGNRQGFGISVWGESETAVNRNRCYDNEQAGICFDHSKGSAEGNESWANRTRHGICVQNQSEVVLTGNRCHSNAGAGIVFTASAGQAEDNICWGNEEGNELVVDVSSVVRGHHATARPVDERFGAGIPTAHPLHDWLLRRFDESPEPEASPAMRLQLPESISIVSPRSERERAASLASYLATGGCSRCFEDFWSQTDAAGATPGTATVRGMYEVFRSRDDARGATIQPVEQKTGATWADARPGLDALKALVPTLGKDWAGLRRKQGRSIDARRTSRSAGATASRWSVALVSADTEGLEHWLTDPGEREAISVLVATSLQEPVEVPAPLQLDMLARVDSPATGSSIDARAARFLEQHVLPDLGSARARWRARFQVDMRLRECLLLVLLPVALASLVFAAMIAMEVANGPSHFVRLLFSPDALLPELRTRSLSMASGDLPWELALAAVSSLFWFALMFCACWNRALPWSLKLMPPEHLLKSALEALNLQQPYARFVSLLNLLAERMHSPDAWRRWLQRQVYGRRRFAWRNRPPRLTLIAVRHMDTCNESEASALRTLLASCPEGDAVLMVTQMPGLSMLVDGYLEVWFPGTQEAQTQSLPMRAFLLHDALSASFPGAGGFDAPTHQADRESATRKLGDLLGWPVERQEGLANTLVSNDAWGITDLLPALVLGSTPAMYMQVSRLNEETDDTVPHREDNTVSGRFRKELEFFNETIETLEAEETGCMPPIPGAGPNLGTIDDLQAMVQRADALQLAKADGRLLWIGRVGHRLELAHAVRDLYSAKGRNCKVYLAELLAISCRYHLQRVLDAIDDPQIDAEGIKRLPLHMEAAVFLLQEQLALSPETSTLFVERWSRLAQVLARPAASTASDPSAGVSAAMPSPSARLPSFQQLCILWLKAIDALRSAGIKVPGSDEMSAKLDDAISRSWGDRNALAPDGSFWTSFVDDIACVLFELAILPLELAQARLKARLGQDWFHLPDRYKTHLLERLPALTEQFAEQYMDVLARQKTADALLRVLEPLRHAPAWTTAALGALTSAAHRASGLSSDTDTHLQRAAETLLELQRRHAGAWPATGVRIPVLPCVVTSAAMILLSDHRNELLAFFDNATNMRAEIRSLEQIEGIALGRHGRLQQAARDEKAAVQLVEYFLGAMPSTRPASVRSDQS